MRSQAAAAALAFRYKSCRAIVRKPAGFRIRPALRCQWEKTSLHPSLRRRMNRPPSAAMAFAPCVLVRSPPLRLNRLIRANSHRPPMGDAGDTSGTMPGQLRVVSPLHVKCACPSPRPCDCHSSSSAAHDGRKGFERSRRFRSRARRRQLIKHAHDRIFIWRSIQAPFRRRRATISLSEQSRLPVSVPVSGQAKQYQQSMKNEQQKQVVKFSSLAIKEADRG
jgi:hypothetical protein